MKKLVVIISMICGCFIITACTDFSLKEDIKTEFKLMENASIDHYEMVLTKIDTNQTYQNQVTKNGQYVILKFQVKNASKQNDTLKADNFQMIINNEEYKALENRNVAMNAGETVEYTIVFDVPVKEEYDLLFYSGIVGNNIKFKIEI